MFFFPERPFFSLSLDTQGINIWNSCLFRGYPCWCILSWDLKMNIFATHLRPMPQKPEVNCTFPLPSVCSRKKSPFMWRCFFLFFRLWDFVDDAWRNTWLPYLDVAWDDLEPSWEVKGTLENKCQPSRKQLMNPSLSLINPHTNALFPWGRCFSCFYLVVTLQILPWHKETGRRGNKLRLNVFFPARF